MADNFTLESIEKTAPWGTAAYGAGLYNGLIYICAIVNAKPNVYTYNPNTGEYATYDINASEMDTAYSIVYFNGCFYSYANNKRPSSDYVRLFYKYDIAARTVVSVIEGRDTYRDYTYSDIFVKDDTIGLMRYSTYAGSRSATLAYFSTETLSRTNSYNVSYENMPVVAQSIDGIFASFRQYSGTLSAKYYGKITNTVTLITTFPVFSQKYSMFEYENNYYLLGGQSKATSSDNWTDSFAIYQVNKTTNAVTTCETQLPSAFVNDNAVVVNNVAYLFNSTTVCKLTFTPPEPDPTKKITVIVSKQDALLKTYDKYCDANILLSLKLQEKSATPSSSQQEIVPDTGNCGLSKVTIGAVQAEAITLTPTRNAQTIEPVEEDSFYSKVTVEGIPDDYIIPSGTQQITANGTYDVTSKANAVVNVPPYVEDVATEAEMDALLIADNVGKYYKFTGTDGKYNNGDIYCVEEG